MEKCAFCLVRLFEFQIKHFFLKFILLFLVIQTNIFANNEIMSNKEITLRINEQVKLMTPEQKKLWKSIGGKKRIDVILPQIRQKLNVKDIEDIDTTTVAKYSVIPVEGIGRLWMPKSSDGEMKLFYSPYYLEKGLLPVHDVPESVRKFEHSFFIDQPVDRELNGKEADFVRALDLCLNKYYTFVCMRGLPIIDRAEYMKGNLTGKILELRVPNNLGYLSRAVHIPTAEEKRKYASSQFEGWSFKQVVTYVKERYPKLTSQYSDIENELFIIFGYPLSINEIVETFYKSPEHKEEYRYKGPRPIGGCFGELQYDIGPITTYAIPFVTKVNKESIDRSIKRLEDVRIRPAYTYGPSYIMEFGFEKILFPAYVSQFAASPSFQKALESRYQTAKKYNVIIQRELKEGRPLPKYILEKSRLMKILQKNYNQSKNSEK